MSSSLSRFALKTRVCWYFYHSQRKRFPDVAPLSIVLLARHTVRLLKVTRAGFLVMPRKPVTGEDDRDRLHVPPSYRHRCHRCLKQEKIFFSFINLDSRRKSVLLFTKSFFIFSISRGDVERDDFPCRTQDFVLLMNETKIVRLRRHRQRCFCAILLWTMKDIETPPVS